MSVFIDVQLFEDVSVAVLIPPRCSEGSYLTLEDVSTFSDSICVLLFEKHGY